MEHPDPADALDILRLGFCDLRAACTAKRSDPVKPSNKMFSIPPCGCTPHVPSFPEDQNNLVIREILVLVSGLGLALVGDASAGIVGDLLLLKRVGEQPLDMSEVIL